MLERALGLLSLIEYEGYRAYLIGGFVRDYLMGVESSDVDIATNATPRQLKEIFPEANLSYEEYGSVTLVYKSVRFEITTFRKENNYANKRNPVEIEYIDNLYEDLLRRDFTINTICMNKDGMIIDLLNGQEDLDKKVIKAVGNADLKMGEDTLRILRAIRFSTTLNFEIEEELKEAIDKYKSDLSLLSYDRKKEELNKIFGSLNVRRGIGLLCDFKLDKHLDLPNLSSVTAFSDILGIWAFLNVSDKYSFTSNEKELMEQINLVKNMDNLSPLNLYYYGLYINTVAGSYKGISKKEITEAYSKLPIKSKKELDIDVEDIINVFNDKPGKYLRDVFKGLEKAVLVDGIDNKKENLLKICVKMYEEKQLNLDNS